MITLEQYAMGRDVQFPEEWALAKPSAIMLLDRVNAVLALKFPNMLIEVASGFRPYAINQATPGASKYSHHITGKAIDLKDRDGRLKKILNPLENPADAELLRSLELFMEDPLKTKTWLHLDMGIRPDRPSRIFKIR